MHFKSDSFATNIDFEDDSNKLYYDTEWNWLMPVAEKICNLTIEQNDGSVNHISQSYSKAEQLIQQIKDILICFNIKALNKNVVEFIKWYNEQNK